MYTIYIRIRARVYERMGIHVFLTQWTDFMFVSLLMANFLWRRSRKGLWVEFFFLNVEVKKAYMYTHRCGSPGGGFM